MLRCLKNLAACPASCLGEISEWKRNILTRCKCRVNGGVRPETVCETFLCVTFAAAMCGVAASRRGRHRSRRRFSRRRRTEENWIVIHLCSFRWLCVAVTDNVVTRSAGYILFVTSLLCERIVCISLCCAAAHLIVLRCWRHRFVNVVLTVSTLLATVSKLLSWNFLYYNAVLLT